MSAVQDAIRQRQQGAQGGRLAWSRRCPLFDETFALVGYVLAALLLPPFYALIAPAVLGLLAPASAKGQAAGWLTYPGPNSWLMRSQQAAVAVACAVAFAVINTCLVAVAAWLANPDARLADMLWDRERHGLDWRRGPRQPR